MRNHSHLELHLGELEVAAAESTNCQFEYRRTRSVSLSDLSSTADPGDLGEHGMEPRDGMGRMRFGIGAPFEHSFIRVAIGASEEVAAEKMIKY